MKHLALGTLIIVGVAGMGLTTTPADARGGLNASYARAYCQYYLNKASTAARGQSTRTLASDNDARKGDRRTAEYWRNAYRECLKDHGY